jgi:uncharacterized protein YecT (DUF1311 family)
VEETFMRKTILFFAIFSIAAGAMAQWEPEVERRLSPAFNECQSNGDAARGITSAMMGCLGEENERQDARLNQAYRMVMKRLPTSGKTKLRQSQRAWIKNRDALAKAAGDRAGGGSASGLEYSGEFLHETIKRVIWLEKYR